MRVNRFYGWCGRVLLVATWTLVFHVVTVHNGRTEQGPLEKWALSVVCGVTLTLFGVVTERQWRRE